MKKFKAFIALDSKTNIENLRVVKKLYPYVYGFKVGYRSFYNSNADKLIKEIKKNKSKLFLDLKLHDIPNTVGSAIESLSKINPDFLTVHISGGKTMLEYACATIKKKKLKTKLLGVTLLTSLDSKDSRGIYAENNTNKLVKKFATLANKSGVNGIICSGNDLLELKKFKNLIKITPGVKMFSRKDDQKRVTYVHEALDTGADYVVIGRELINNKDPRSLLQSYYEKNQNQNLWTN
jgi:orotidine-5'-phosphate decarboxylase